MHLPAKTDLVFVDDWLKPHHTSPQLVSLILGQLSRVYVPHYHPPLAQHVHLLHHCLCQYLWAGDAGEELISQEHQVTTTLREWVIYYH